MHGASKSLSDATTVPPNKILICEDARCFLPYLTRHTVLTNPNMTWCTVLQNPKLTVFPNPRATRQFLQILIWRDARCFTILIRRDVRCYQILIWRDARCYQILIWRDSQCLQILIHPQHTDLLPSHLTTHNLRIREEHRYALSGISK